MISFKNTIYNIVIYNQMIYYKIYNIVYITDTDPLGVTEHSQSAENQQYVWLNYLFIFERTLF